MTWQDQKGQGIQDKARQGRRGQDKPNHVKIRQVKTRLAKTRQYKSRQDQPRQDKTSRLLRSTVCACFLPKKHMADTFDAMETSILCLILQFKHLFSQYERLFQQDCIFLVVIFVVILRNCFSMLRQIEEYDPSSWQYHKFVLSQYYPIQLLCYYQWQSMTLHHSSIASLFRQYYDFVFSYSSFRH